MSNTGNEENPRTRKNAASFVRVKEEFMASNSTRVHGICRASEKDLLLTTILFTNHLKAGKGAAANAEHVEKLIPKSFGLGLLASFLRPFAGKVDRVVADFVPGKRHDF